MQDFLPRLVLKDFLNTNGQTSSFPLSFSSLTQIQLLLNPPYTFSHLNFLALSLFYERITSLDEHVSPPSLY